MKIVILASLAYSLVNFRGALIAAMVVKGHDVVACAPDHDPETEQKLAGMGVRYRRIPMDRTGLNPFRDLATLRHLVRLVRDEDPDVVLAYTQKPIVYGGIATRLAGNGAQFHAMVSGLGHVYGREGGVKRAMLRMAVSWLYRIAVARAATVFVFNRDDAGEMRRHGILRPEHRVVQVPGSGVDPAHFAPHPIPAGPPVFLMIARLMRDKGLLEFVEAARLVHARFPEARFHILGPMDSNPTGIGAGEIATWTAAGDIE
jgi:glycosyltransferase involved in cell wall biosynthesis